MKGICVNFLHPDLFFIPLGTLPWQPILGNNLQNDLYSTRWNFEYRKSDLEAITGTILRSSFIWHAGILKRIEISNFWFQQVNQQSFLYILWKFGEILISDPKVLGKKLYVLSR